MKAKLGLELQPNIAIRLLIAVPFLSSLILQVKAQKITDGCVRRRNLSIVDLLATLVQQPDGVVLVRRFRRFETFLPLYLVAAADINDAGEITGMAIDNAGAVVGFVADPNPEQRLLPGVAEKNARANIVAFSALHPGPILHPLFIRLPRAVEPGFDLLHRTSCVVLGCLTETVRRVAGLRHSP